MVKIFKKKFEKKITELGFTFQPYPDGLYILHQINNADRNTSAQLICSEPINDLIHESHNRNVIQSIGHFKLRLLTESKKPDFFILAFQNAIKQSVEFIIIPYSEFTMRLTRSNGTSIDNQKFEIVFWLMPDDCLYDTTNISIEGEWYFLSKGVSGRMIDRTDWDYTDFLHNWDQLKINI